MSNADWHNTTARQARVVTNKRGLWLFPVLVLLFVVFSAMLLLFPSFRVWRELKAQIDQQEIELAALSEKRQNLETLSNQNLDEKQLLLEKVIPSHKPVFEFLIAMEHEASMAGVLLGSYELNPGSLATDSAEQRHEQTSPETPGTLAILPVEMEMSGTLDQISDFLQRLEILAPLVGLKQMELSLGEVQGAAEGQESIRSVEVKLDLYYAVAPDSIESTLASRGFTRGDEALFELLRTYSNHQLESLNDSGELIERENPFSY